MAEKLSEQEKKGAVERASEKRLAVLHAFLRANFIAVRSLPAELVNANSFNTCLGKDDIRLSTLFKIFNYYNYRLKIYLQPKDREQAALYRSLCVQVNKGDFNGEGEKRMAFLRDYMSINNMTQIQIAKKLGIVHSTMINWFKVDDTMLSWVYKMAHIFDVDIYYIVEPLSVPVPVREDGGNAFMIEMHTYKSCPCRKELLKNIY